ncbi:MAG TPA: hypothetical protein VH157_05385 [Bryobacteraceae bacterium]|nr:hypothetical protein [Bryobacteraceae bacterium]
MRNTRLLTISAFLAFLFALAPPASAQWLNYPTARVPRLRDGKPNLSAPAPRTKDGKPDLSGIWQLEARCPPEGCGDYPAAPEFGDLGARLQGGLPYQPWARELVEKRWAQLGKDDPVGSCRPAGAIRLLTFPPPRKIVQLPALILILSERDVTYRQIFTDGRPLPKDPDPSWNGFSTAKWDGDTLIAQTIGLRDGTWLDRKGSPMTDAAKITERFRRVNYGRLEIELTVDDLKAYTQPWTVTLNQNIVLNTELLDYYCLDNERDATHMIGK